MTSILVRLRDYLRRLTDRTARLAAALFPVAMLMFAAIAFVIAERGGWFDPEPPSEWRSAAEVSEILQLDGWDVEYWGRPDARYSRYATRGQKQPRGIIIHYTFPKRPADIVKYGHIRDYGRGGASFGYHFYVSATGKIYQGAPLSKRTNHIKYLSNSRRTDVAKHLWSGNTIGISLVGGCDPMLAPVLGSPLACAHETVSGAQLDAGLAIIRRLREKYDIPCGEVYGHGDLQTDRLSFEGATLTKLAREDCSGEIESTAAEHS